MASKKPKPQIVQVDEPDEPITPSKRDNRTEAAQEFEIPEVQAVLPLREFVLFPGTIIPLSLETEKSRRLVNDILPEQRTILVTCQKDPDAENPSGKDLHAVGTVAAVLKLLRREDDQQTLIVQGIRRGRVRKWVDFEPYITANVELLESTGEDSKMIEALARNVRELGRQAIELSPNIPEEAVSILRTVEPEGMLADFVVANLQIEPKRKQEFLEETGVRERLEMLNVELQRQIELLELSEKIQKDVRSRIEKQHREHFLQEQLRAIQKELGTGDEKQADIEMLREKIDQARMPETVQAEADRELSRMQRVPIVSPEYNIVRTYLEILGELPWNRSSEDHLEVPEARKVLNTDHYDLDKVKKRILEYLSVRKLAPTSRGPILCFVGPPGVGKTSLGQSIARALGREFIRMSLGGMRDEAELRGHRRTYIGAMPGRIIQEIRKVGVNNPVFMLDELDKVGADFRGDPTSALLEVLDPAQNKSFQDHYLSVPFDLSKVLFIATANYMGPVPPALRDRMEVIEIPGYAQADKLNIARQYLVPRQREQNGLKVSQITFKDEAIRRIIEQYTREAGVRELERKIGACCRYVAALVAEGKAKSRTVTRKLLVDALGPRIYQRDVAGRTNVSGVVTGLAHTPSGGDIIFIEAAAYNGKGQLILTGQIGDVMRESAQAAYSLVKSKADGIGIKPEVFAGTDVHIHVPAGAIPKDGPSAGIAILTALTSLFTEHKVRADVAMTGEITLRGLVLPVGGVRVKVLAAKRAGIRRVLLPEDNRKDLQEIPEDVRDSLEFVFVKTADDVMNAALDLQVSEDPPKKSKAGSSSKARRSKKKSSSPSSSAKRKSAAGSGKGK